jgi:hypothetical protein
MVKIDILNFLIFCSAPTQNSSKGTVTIQIDVTLLSSLFSIVHIFVSIIPYRQAEWRRGSVLWAVNLQRSVDRNYALLKLVFAINFL